MMGLGEFLQRHQRWILYVYSFVTVTLVAATVYGWPALRRELRNEGSTLTEDQFGAIFTVGAWSTQGLRFGTGLLRDRFGTKRVCAAALFCTAFGFAGMAWSDANQPMSLAISMLIIGMGSGAQITLQPVAGVFPKHSGSILSSLSGAAQLSGLIFFLLTSLGSRRTAFAAFAGVQVIMAVIALIILPNGGSFVEFVQGKDGNNNSERTFATSSAEIKSAPQDTIVEMAVASDPTTVVIKQDMDVPTNPVSLDNIEAGISAVASSSDQTTMPTPVLAEQPLESHTSIQPQSPSSSSPPPTAREQLLCLEYILLLSWFSLSVAPLFYYVGSIGFQLENMGDDDGVYTNIFTILFSMAALFSPVGGWIADSYGLGVAEAFGSFLSAVAFFCLSSEGMSLRAHIVGLACYGVGRMTVFGSFFSHIGKRFGYQNYGTLAGCGLICSALLSLLQYPMISAAASGHSQKVNLMSGGLFVSMIPYFVWLNRKERREMQIAKGR